MAVAAGIKERITTTHRAAADGRAAMKAKTAARISKVVESPSQRSLSELAANEARFESVMADTILWKAEACMIAPTASKSAANARRNRGRGLTIFLKTYASR